MTLNVKLLVPKLMKLHYRRQCNKLMGITLVVVNINSLTIQCCSSEWWLELTEFLVILSILLTFIKATADTARRSLMPSENSRQKMLPRVENVPRDEKAASRGRYSSNRPSNWGESQSWGTCVYLVISEIAEIGPMFRPLFSLVFPNWNTTIKQKFSQWKSTQTP